MATRRKKPTAKNAKRKANKRQCSTCKGPILLDWVSDELCPHCKLSAMRIELQKMEAQLNGDQEDDWNEAYLRVSEAWAPLDPALTKEEKRLARQVLAIGSIRARSEFLDALGELARRLPNIETFSGKPGVRVGFSAKNPSDYKRAEEILEALRLAFDADPSDLEELHVPALRQLKKRAGTDDLTGATYRKPADFGEALIRLIEEIQAQGYRGAQAAPHVANWVGWQRGPYERLRSLRHGHPWLYPRVEKWAEKEFETREQPNKLARSLLRALGLSDQQARNTARKATVHKIIK